MVCGNTHVVCDMWYVYVYVCVCVCVCVSMYVDALTDATTFCLAALGVAGP